MAEDWDLYAVVRSYANAAATSTASSTTTNATNNPIIGSAVENTYPELGDSSFANLSDPFLNADNPSDFPGFVPRQEDSFQGLEEIYKEQYENTEPYAAAITTTTSLPHHYGPSNSVVQEFHKQQQYTPQPEQFSLYPQHSQHMMQPQQQQQQQQHLHVILGSSSLSFPSTSPQPIRSRRRKNQQAKMVHRMTQEELSGDSWAWRKYGQKPIKGSPYPRNYYRCSTSKGCVARRQVERCPTDPNMYVVSYSGQHSHPRPTHRSSLAGSTRTKTAAKPSTSSEPAHNTAPTSTSMASSSSPVSGSSFSPRGESAAEEGADAENQNAENILGGEEEGDGWDEEEEGDDDDDDDDDNNGDGEILIPNTLIDHY